MQIDYLDSAAYFLCDINRQEQSLDMQVQSDVRQRQDRDQATSQETSYREISPIPKSQRPPKVFALRSSGTSPVRQFFSNIMDSILKMLLLYIHRSVSCCFVLCNKHLIIGTEAMAEVVQTSHCHPMLHRRKSYGRSCFKTSHCHPMDMLTLHIKLRQKLF